MTEFLIVLLVVWIDGCILHPSFEHVNLFYGLPHPCCVGCVVFMVAIVTGRADRVNAIIHITRLNRPE